MGKTIITAIISGCIALGGGVLLGFVLHRTMGPSPSQSASSRLEEHVLLAVGNDNRQYPPEQQFESLALLVGERVIDAAKVYPDADAASRERIQRNIERVLHAGLLEHIPYADKRAASIAHALCLREAANVPGNLKPCLRRSNHASGQLADVMVSVN